jgi:hypothetical protein
MNLSTPTFARVGLVDMDVPTEVSHAEKSITITPRLTHSNVSALVERRIRWSGGAGTAVGVVERLRQ